MILWTIQPAELYAQIMKDGYYQFDPDKATKDTAFMFEAKNAYDWLATEMIKRIGKPPHGVSYPVWAWYIYDFKRKKPDLRKAEYGIKGEQMVCLEIDIPDNEVVLSDEEKWHHVLGNWYIYSANCEKDFNEEVRWFDKLTEDKKQEEIISSWQRVFDVEPVNNGFEIQGRFVQATFWKLKAEQIRKVQFFTAR
ncbi:MAG TPA: DUF3841 domain-containing protein [Ruminococcus sp.]|nr:DUF3841 domain-containing protein [Ruminococcus sp.]